MSLKGLLKQWLCQIIGHKTDGRGYFLEYVKPTKKIPFGYYHDLLECARCGMVVRIDSETFDLKTFREWEKAS